MRTCWLAALAAAGLSCFGHAAMAEENPKPTRARQVWERIGPYFAPPKKFAGDLGSYRPVLKFYDGREVKTPADWQERRSEILQRWHQIMGPWPRLLEEPTLERLDAAGADNFTRHKVWVPIAPGRRTIGYLLVPNGPGPFPAVITVYYDPETAAGMTDKKHRDFAYQLARRGFVTLSLGWFPRSRNVRVQPLSFLAYAAANARNALAAEKEVDGRRIGIMGHSYGGKWAMFAACLDEKFAAACVSDPGIVFDESRANVNYWERWYLGYTPEKTRPEGRPGPKNPRTGAYKKLVEAGMDLHELHALMAPRPFFVSGGAEDPPQRWRALNHLVAVNKLLGFAWRVGMANRKHHSPGPADNELCYLFFEYFLKEAPPPKPTARPD